MNNNVQEDYVSFEVSKLLKERGFEWKSTTLVVVDGKLEFENVSGVPQNPDNWYNCYEENGKPITPRKYTKTNTHYPRPTHALAIKWIRANFNKHIWIDCDNQKRFTFTINFMDGYYIQPDDEYNGKPVNEKENWWLTPEEATEEALIYILKNLTQ